MAAVVTVDKVLQLPGGKMRAHICSGQHKGWASAKMLECKSKRCGHCYSCDTAILPLNNAGMKLRQDERVEEVIDHCLGLPTRSDEHPIRSFFF